MFVVSRDRSLLSVIVSIQQQQLRKVHSSTYHLRPSSPPPSLPPSPPQPPTRSSRLRRTASDKFSLVSFSFFLFFRTQTQLCVSVCACACYGGVVCVCEPCACCLLRLLALSLCLLLSFFLPTQSGIIAWQRISLVHSYSEEPHTSENKQPSYQRKYITHKSINIRGAKRETIDQKKKSRPHRPIPGMS